MYGGYFGCSECGESVGCGVSVVGCDCVCAVYVSVWRGVGVCDEGYYWSGYAGSDAPGGPPSGVVIDSVDYDDVSGSWAASE